MKKMIATVAVLLTAAPVLAAPLVDGTRDVDYGSPLAVQTVQTQFGDNTDPLGFGGGGELDAAYATVTGGRLYVLLTGNIEPSFNKVSVFFDTKPGGENVLSGVPQYDFNNVSQNFGGLMFDAGFEADYHLYARWGGGAFEVDIVDRAGGTSAAVNGNGAAASVGAGTGIQAGTVNPGDVGFGAAGPFLNAPLEFGFNNTNILGVQGGTGAANQAAAAAVPTGLEFSIDLADLGSPSIGDQIKIHAVYGNGDNNFHSNQTLAGLPAGTGNLGGDGAGNFTGNLAGVNFKNFAGDQFFTLTIIPEPASLALAGVGCLALAAGARRRRG